MREAFKRIGHTLRLVHTLDKQTLPLDALCGCLRALSPYAALLLSSSIVSGLVAAAGRDYLVRIALWGVALIFILSLLSAWVDRLRQLHHRIVYERYDARVGIVTMEMDYPTLESPYTQQMKDRIRQDNNWGSGIYGVFFTLENLIGGFFAMVSGIILIFPLLRNEALSAWTVAGYLALVMVITTITVLLNNHILLKRFFSLLDSFSSSRFFYAIFQSGLDGKGGKDARIYNVRDLVSRSYEDYRTLLNRFGRQTSSLQGLTGLLNNSTSSLIQGSAYLFVAIQAVRGAIDLGDVVRYAGAVYAFSNGIKNMISNFFELDLVAKRQESTLDYLSPPRVLHQGTLPVEKRSDYAYELAFHNVSFRYPGQEAFALKDVSLTLQIGKKLAVVGMNGSGKTTLIKLLCRLYEPEEGAITLNGIDISKYDYNEYMRIFSVVFQDFKLFSLPLNVNVAASQAPDDARVHKCLTLAGFGKRLEEIPLDAPLYNEYEENGLEISGGEAQKIALARALYKDAPFVILDEPTASLDPIAESEIYERFDEIVGEKTAIYISHRLSSCRFCSDIAVFDGGRIVQRGSHDALLADRDGKYYALWNAQAQYYV